MKRDAKLVISPELVHRDWAGSANGHKAQDDTPGQENYGARGSAGTSEKPKKVTMTES